MLYGDTLTTLIAVFFSRKKLLAIAVDE